MLMTKASRPAVRTLRGWAISVLQNAGAIRECEEHGWMQDRADPNARERAFEMASTRPRRASLQRPLPLQSLRSWRASATPALWTEP